MCNWKIKDSDKCNFCETVDDIIHFFICNKERIFWSHLFNWWNGLSEVKIDKDSWDLKKGVPFGFHIEHDQILPEIG